MLYLLYVYIKQCLEVKVSFYKKATKITEKTIR